MSRDGQHFDFVAMDRVRDKVAAIRAAMRSGQPELVKQLLRDSGADCNAIMLRTNDQGRAILHEAVCSKDLEMVKAIVEGGGIVDVPSNEGTPAYLAAVAGQLERLRFLASNGADLNYRHPSTGYSLLMAAIWGGHGDCALWMIEQGAVYDGSVRSARGWTTLDFAATGPDERIFFALAEKGALQERGKSALEVAVGHHAKKMVRACLGHPEYRKPLFEPGYERVLEACVFDDMKFFLLSERSQTEIVAVIGGSPSTNPSDVDPEGLVDCAELPAPRRDKSGPAL
jgi:hypothetical protein